MIKFNQIYVSYWFIFLFVLTSGCAGTLPGLLNSLNKGQLIPSEQIERYKNMPEDSPELKSLRELAEKDPQGMIATSLKCAGKFGTQINSATPPNAKEDNLGKKNKTEKEECYWKSPSMGNSNPFTAQQESMTASLRGALINLGKSQIIMAKALGLDEQVLLAKNNAKSLEEGDLGTGSEIDKALEISETVQDAIDKETAKKKVLDVESKKVFITSIPFYIKGVTNSIQTGKEAASISTSLLSLSPAALLQIGALFSIVKNLPDLVSQLAGSTGKIMDFMTANEIDSSEMKDQLSGVF
jgi:hypothetical protein